MPLHVLEQVNAVPYAFEGDSLCVAIADPQNIHGIDALRLASRHPLALRVAAHEDDRSLSSAGSHVPRRPSACAPG